MPVFVGSSLLTVFLCSPSRQKKRGAVDFQCILGLNKESLSLSLLGALHITLLSSFVSWGFHFWQALSQDPHWLEGCLKSGSPHSVYPLTKICIILWWFYVRENRWMWVWGGWGSWRASSLTCTQGNHWPGRCLEGVWSWFPLKRSHKSGVLCCACPSAFLWPFLACGGSEWNVVTDMYAQAALDT